jgi:hypothetical protein
MLDEIQPGQPIRVRITGYPTAEAQRKTLMQLCEQDKSVQTERKRLKRARAVRWRTRAGRPWGGRSPRIQVVQVAPGAAYTIFGSVDVLRKLKSVEKIVEVTPS